MVASLNGRAKGIMRYGTARSQTSVLLWTARLNPVIRRQTLTACAAGQSAGASAFIRVHLRFAGITAA